MRKFNDKAPKFNLFKSVSGKYFTAEEMQEALKPLQTDKNEQLIVLYTSNEKDQHSFIESAKEPWLRCDGDGFSVGCAFGEHVGG
jgi:molecular chaperone HtpG